MPVYIEIADSDDVYVITFTCTNRLPLFHLSNSYDVVFNWFGYLKSQGHYMIGYMIMPNHVHALYADEDAVGENETIVCFADKISSAIRTHSKVINVGIDVAMLQT